MKGWAKGKNKEKKNKGNKGKNLGWYKNGKIDPNNPELPPGYDMINPEVFEVTNYINDINQEYIQVLMTTDKEGNYRAAYTYGLERIGVETYMHMHNEIR